MKEKIVLFVYQNPILYPPTINAANLLIEKGYEVHLVGLSYPVPGYIEINANVNTLYLGKLRSGWLGVINYFLIFIRFFLLIKEIKPKNIISYDAYASVITGALGFIYKVKWVYYQHDYFEQPVGLWQTLIFKLEAYFTRFAIFWCFPQIERSELFKKRVGRDMEVLIIHNGPRRSWGIGDNMPHVLIDRVKQKFNNVLIYQGGWSYDFHLDNLVRIMAHVNKECCLMLIGKEHEIGIQKELEALIVQLKLEDRVFIVDDYIPYDELSTITRYCDIGVTILLTDEDKIPVNLKHLAGASNKIGEYAAAGLHILTSGSQSNKYFFKNYPIATFCDPYDHVSSAQKVNELLNDKVSLVQLGEKSKLCFDETLNFDIQFEKLLNRL